ncbi:hypothetical protein [Gandjariella thermophila]|uniref:Uncharacterized protein n=1 Tax=Gandjariella thermophila TaxID=1931992 RepID=A0A4D4JAP0_9PSEU|nr:hypothetical protein [Gandjariella thermophila]GDY33885.1 hypothetical protein GTS_55180 [Gandjariella thermophila]
MVGGGYSYDPARLTDIAGKLRDGAKALADTARSAPPSPDAGTSSAVVGEALKALVRAGATAVARMDDVAGKVHASQGSYDTVENTNTGVLGPK